MYKRKSMISEGMNAAQSVHDFHKFGVHPNSVAPGFHFHLAASINPDTDIPLMSPLGGRGLSFVVHWLNNKELHFTLESECILQEMARQSRPAPDAESVSDEYETGSHDGGATEEEAPQPLAPVPSEPVLSQPKLKKLPKSMSYMSTESERSTASHLPPVHDTKVGALC
jgi:hypothetical protein